MGGRDGGGAGPLQEGRHSLTVSAVRLWTSSEAQLYARVGLDAGVGLGAQPVLGARARPFVHVEAELWALPDGRCGFAPRYCAAGSEERHSYFPAGYDSYCLEDSHSCFPAGSYLD